MSIKNFIKNKKALAILGGSILLLLLVIILATNLSNRRINMQDIVNLNYDGFDGYATVTTNVDPTMLSTSELDDVEKRKIHSVLGTVKCSVSPNENLKNGDSVNVKIVYDESMAKKYKIKLLNDSFKLTVSGLEEGTVIDLFQDMKVEYSGYSLKGQVKITNTSTDDFFRTVFYHCENNGHLKNGDQLTITANYNEYNAKQNKYIILTSQTTDVVKGLSEYILNASQLTEPVLKTINANAEDSANAYTAKYTSSVYREFSGAVYTPLKNVSDIQLVQLTHKYLLSAKDTDISNVCYMYYFYDTSITAQVYGKSEETKSGTIVLQVEKPALDSDGNLLPFPDRAITYVGAYANFDSAYQKTIVGMQDKYTVNEIS